MAFWVKSEEERSADVGCFFLLQRSAVGNSLESIKKPLGVSSERFVDENARRASIANDKS
jgi:hypothetical protein